MGNYIMPIILILTGIFGVLIEFEVLILSWGQIWPFYLIVVGVVLLFNELNYSFKKSKKVKEKRKNGE